MDRHESLLMFACDQWYLDQGRYLTRYEVVLIMRLIFFGDKYEDRNKVFEIFANPNHVLTKACQSLDESLKAACIGKIKVWLKELREDNVEARDIEMTLRGL